MMWDRSQVKKKLQALEKEADFYSALLKSRKGIYLICDKKGTLSSLDNVKQWFGIENHGMDLDCLRDENTAFSNEQFSDFVEDIERLISLDTVFRKSFYLKKQQRHIIVKGDILEEHHKKSGYIIWFKDASIEENIAAFQKRDVRQIANRLRLFETTSDLINIPMWMRDDKLRLIWVNKAYIDAVDAETAEQVIEQGLELVTNAVGKNMRDLAAKSRDLHETYIEKHFVVIRGERCAVNVCNFPIAIDQNMMGCVGYAQDITELEKARGELIYHTESHSETLNKLSTAVAIFTSGKRLEYYNSAFSRLWNLSEELLFSHPHHGEVLEAMREARRLPEQANFPKWKTEQLSAYTQLLEPVEEMWHLPDNTSLRVVSQPHPLGGLLIFYEDVTDHFALERSYNTLFAVQRETLNNLHEAVAVFGIDGCLQLYNDAFVDTWKLDREMLDANPHTMNVMAAFAENYGESYQIKDLKNLIVGGEVKKELSSGQLKRKDDSVLNYAAVPLPDGAMLITFIDVSDSFAIEKVLRQRNQALEEADKIKTDFLAHMSYELRTPLNSIIGFAELLEKEYQGPLNDIQHEYMYSILAASGQLLELFNDILDLTVIEAGGLTLDIDQFELPTILDQVINQLQERIKVKELDLILQCKDDLMPVWGDARRIHHAIYNLLSNAVKFSHPLGIINVTADQNDENYTITIQDTGIGIKPEEVDKLFEKFFTGSNTSNTQGAGLGLSLVKNFVDLHGGKIDVQSALNEGTCVTLSLPIKVGMDTQISLASE
ncbi:MAG: PAS-domain containing protein [Emcibacter sp.]|nr:PAS-domain containing protein [Emcibacter sp.]